jgi:hypothetical protein
LLARAAAPRPRIADAVTTSHASARYRLVRQHRRSARPPGVAAGANHGLPIRCHLCSTSGHNLGMCRPSRGTPGHDDCSGAKTQRHAGRCCAIAPSVAQRPGALVGPKQLRAARRPHRAMGRRDLARSSPRRFLHV